MISKENLKIQNVFNQNRQVIGIKSGYFFAEDSKMVICTEREHHLWILSSQSNHAQLTTEISNATIFKLKPSLVLVYAKKNLFALDCYNYQIVHQVKLPQDILDFKFVSESFVCVVYSSGREFHLKMCHLNFVNEEFSLDDPEYTYSSAFSIFEIRFTEEKNNSKYFQVILFMNDGFPKVLTLETSGDSACVSFDYDIILNKYTLGQMKNKASFNLARASSYKIGVQNNTSQENLITDITASSLINEPVQSMTTQTVSTTQRTFKTRYLDDFTCAHEDQLFVTCKTVQGSMSSPCKILLNIYKCEDLISFHECEFEPSDFLDEQDRFRLYSMACDHKMYIYVYGSQGLFVFLYVPKRGVQFLRKADIYVNQGTQIFGCNKEKVIFLASKNNLEIWDKKVKVKIFYSSFCENIIKLQMGHSGSYIGVYDLNCFYKFDTCNLEVVGSRKCSSNCQKHSIQVVDLGLFQNCASFSLPIYDKKTWRFSVFGSSVGLSFGEFSFYGLFNAFSDRHYTQFFEYFKDFYFEKADQKKWGQLNPVNLAIYHNDEKLLKSTLKKNDLPYNFKEDNSIIETAYNLGHFTLIQALCSVLNSKKKSQLISKKDFKKLLSNNLEEGHALLSKQLVSFKCFDNYGLVFICSEFKIMLSNSLIDFLYLFNKERTKLSERNKKILSFFKKCESDTDQDSCQSEFLKQLNESHVEILTTPFEYDFSIGSKESLDFLSCYSTTSSSELILSDWKYLIQYKWLRLHWFNLFIACLYWAFMVTATLKIIFYKSDRNLIVVSTLFVCFFIAFELLQIVCFVSYKIRLYFLNLTNVLDILLFSLSLFYIHTPIKNRVIHKLSGSVVLVGIYYRSFIFLSIFKPLNSLIGIINTIVVRILKFLFVLVYFYTATGLMFAYLNDSMVVSQYFVYSYIWVLFGGLEKSDLAIDSLSSLAIVLGTIFITIILLNILIAYLSNLFSRLEEEQKKKELQGQSSIVLNSEVLIYFFRTMLKYQAKTQVRVILRAETNELLS